MTSQQQEPVLEPTAEGFLRAALRSGLFTRDQLQAALRGVPKDRRDDARSLADHLVATGKLTRFQASKLLRGISQGLILGPFHLLTPVGKGGMGTVFLVRDTRSDQLVALKILPPRVAREEERMLARFRREMTLSQRVAHPHLCWTYDVGEFRGVHYLAMEFIPGRTLSRLVAEEGPLPVKRAARLLSEVALALNHAHEAGLIHRDLKPSNIMITPRDHAKVLDLGLALEHGETGEAQVVGGQGYIVGSMDYISPEQTLDAIAVDGRSDIYSMGCTLYFALTGSPPFPGGTSKEKIQRHRNDIPRPLIELAPHVPPGFVAIVEKMMDKDPSRRFATARGVAEELRAWADEGGQMDNPEEVRQAEEQLMAQGSGSLDIGLEVLPEVEVIAEPEEPIPPWLLGAMALGVVMLVVAAVVGILGVWLAG